MSNITLPRAFVEEMRELIRIAFYNPYGSEFRNPYKHQQAALAVLAAALAEPEQKPEPYTLAELFAQFAAKQRPLDADMAAIINANLDSLYITDEPAAAKPEPATEKDVDIEFCGITLTSCPIDSRRDFRTGFRAAERFHGIGGSKT